MAPATGVEASGAGLPPLENPPCPPLRKGGFEWVAVCGIRRARISPPRQSSKEALIKSRMRDRGDLGLGQVGEDAV